MNLKIEFAMRALECTDFSELCREYGISRKTGYKWKQRFLNGGFGGLADQSRKPRSHPAGLDELVVCEMIALKNAHPNWGPRKIRELYRRKHPGEPPSESSFKRVLEKAGLTKPRRRQRVKQSGRLASGRKAAAPNEVWTVDFKGWWHDPSGSRVEPLTVRDEFSRMVLELRAVANARTETIRQCFERLFQRHGLPAAIRSDNGPPFGSSAGLLGLSRLSAWWLALGIDLERGRPGCPQDNGAHERLHLDIMRDLEQERVGRDQAAFDLWRRQFNLERPHEALAMACPAEVYKPSERPYKGTPEAIDYEAMATRKVHRQCGHIVYESEKIFLSTALGGWQVGLPPCEDGRREVWFSRVLLGHIEERTSSFKPLQITAGGGGGADSATLHRLPARRTSAS